MRAILDQHTTDDANAAAEDTAAVVLLDVKKAYDTLDRDFVATALVDFGYSAAFVELVQRLHAETSAQFLVNGELSDPFNVITGIRQGCPLAPLLFLIAVEPLKHAIDQDPELRGIRLQRGAVGFDHTFSAFVDDSVVFVERGAMMPALERVLSDFAALSGLQVQPHKSHVLVLNRQCADSTLGSFPIVPVGSTVTYLGTQMCIADLEKANWDKRCSSVQQRLGILSQYTTGVTDRVHVINLACIPSLLFTANFFTPPRSHQLLLEGIWRQYVWDRTITTAPRRAHKLAAEIVHLPRFCGGLRLRDYRVAMKAQAATAIIHWNSRSDDKYWTAFANLLSQPTEGQAAATIQVYPSATAAPISVLQNGNSLHRIGLQLVNEALTRRYPHPDGLLQAMMATFAAVSEPWKGLRWLTTQQGQLQLRSSELSAWTSLAQLNYAQMPAEIRTYWATFPWYDNEWIRDESGEVLRRSQFPFIHITTLAELHLQQAGPAAFTFRNPAGPVETMHKSTRHRLAQWLRVVLANFAALPLQPPIHDTNRVFAATRHPVMDVYEWRFTEDTVLTGRHHRDKTKSEDDATRATIFARLNPWRDPIDFLNATPAAQADLETLQPMKIFMDGHPPFQQGPTMRVAMTNGQSLNTAHSVVRHWVEPAANLAVIGLEKLLHRLGRQREQQPEIHSALQATTATKLARKPWGVTSQQHLLRYRLTVGGLNVRDNTGARMHCPFEFCHHTDDFSAEHVVWTCAAARAFWERVCQRWTAGAAGFQPDTVVQHVFEPHSPPIGPHVRLALQQISHSDTLINHTVSAVWTVITYCATQQLWLLRNAATFTGATPSRPEHLATMFATIRHQLTALSAERPATTQDTARARIIQELATVIDKDSTPTAVPEQNIRLCFDGGSRGNPGRTGTGSVLIERSVEGAPWEIVWWDAHYLGDDSTNNVAEHTALWRGLQEATRRYSQRGQHVTIIGDSQLVITQLQGKARAAHHGIRDLVMRSGQLLRQLTSYDLQHTLRQGNKMADCLANWAMDHGRTSSLAPQDDGLLRDINEHLRTDTTTAWTTRNPPIDCYHSSNAN